MGKFLALRAGDQQTFEKFQDGEQMPSKDDIKNLNEKLQFDEEMNNDHWRDKIDAVKKLYKSRSLSMGYIPAEEEPWKNRKRCWQCPWIDFPMRMKISFKSKFKHRWDLLIVVLAVYNSFIIPFE